MSLDELYTPKQQDIFKFAYNVDYFMLILHGAKRCGKTITNNDLFLNELRRVRKIADEKNVETPLYILAGVSIGTIFNNVLNELTNKYGIEFNLDKFNRFDLFGVKVCCTGHSTIRHVKAIRGMEAFGAYINEGSLADQGAFDEIKSRCSGTGARILVDTNPDHPEHFLKRDYIDKADGKTIAEFSFEIDDNTFLDERYRQSIKASTPSGVFYDRNIKGLWVSADGVVYKDFNKDVHYISEIELEDINFVKYFAGVDWGYKHHGVIVVIGEDDEGNYYLIEEHAKQLEEIDYWVKVAKGIKSRYGDINFYCDTARTEHIDRFTNEGLKAFYANKSVVSGIESVATLFKNERLYIVKERVTLFRKEIYMYVWSDKGDEPVKVWDNVMDALRYAIYSENSLIMSLPEFN